MAKKRTISQKSSRPPVVVVLGHVDHGKTTLLDKIRKTNVVAKEFGGITQHIGAYQIKVKEREGERVKGITFIDTPGHAAFSEMRSRGAKVADLAVLVIAADEGVKPQTTESLKYIKKAKIPYLVAINKIDKPNIDLEWVKKDMAENDISVESQGGKIVSVLTSAKTGKGIDELLEMILLVAEMEEVRGDSKAKLEAVIIESKLDKRRGPLATILVRNGSLEVGNQIEADGAFAKIKAMFDANGQSIKLAGPSKPVEVLGFKTVPPIGSLVHQGVAQPRMKPKASIKRAEEIVAPSAEQPKPELAKKEKAEEGRLRLIIKADVNGSLEAILAGLPKDVEIIDSGVGEVNESDVLLADTTVAEIIAFNVKNSVKVKKLAVTEKVKISDYQVIYKLFEEVEEKVKKLMEPFAGEEILGQAEILKEFEIDKKRVAGCRVTEGEIKKTAKFHLQRGGELIGDCRIKSMKTGKEKIEGAKAGEEFGAILSPSLDFKIGDMLISYRKVEG
ncbi:translation initiation factor IF-2 [Patescibacteria group bacterium]|nr:translation initiation factor IF-2 [Patescibacteria group bacterium]